MKVTLKDIEEAKTRIEGIVKRTSLIKSISTSKLIGSEIYFKYENEQIAGSFKIRGALNKISTLNDFEKKQGVVTSSAGNHAQGVAYSATKCGVASTIVMPEGAPLIKVNATREYGANVILHGQAYDDAYEHARVLEKEKSMTFVHAFCDEKIIAGQGTVGLEIYESLPDVDSVVVPIGGGGLISGVAIAMKAKNPKIKIYGVQSDIASGMTQLFHNEKPIYPNRRLMTIADGIAIKKPNEEMYEQFIKKYVDEIVTVTDEEIAESIFYLIERLKSVTEGSGAASLAAVMQKKLSLGKKSCVILSGGNIDLNIIAKVIDQGLVRKGRLVEIAVVVPDIPGLLSQITSVIAAERANVLQVYHDRSDRTLHLRETRIQFVLETTSHEHVDRIKRVLQSIDGVKLL
jgi:threonine dehydratase